MNYPADRRPLITARPHKEGFEVTVTWPGSVSPQSPRLMSLSTFWELVNDLASLHTETTREANQYELFTDEEGSKS